MRDQVAEVRSFNRFYTRQIGLLDEHIIKSRFSLPEGRILYELATRGHATGAELARLLDVDPAYISRILQKFLAEELVVLTPNIADRRSNQIALSLDGDAAAAELDRGSDASVAALLQPLAPIQRARLVDAMRAIRQILGEEVAERPLILRPPRVGELGWLIHRNGVLYNQQFGWNAEFEALVAKLYGEYQLMPEAPPKALWVAERQDQILGSVYVVPAEAHERTAQLRMLYVEPEARGHGLGSLLVDQSIRFARESGYRRMRLWTQSVLTSARRIYAAAGFQLVESKPHKSFGYDLVGETWECTL